MASMIEGSKVLRYFLLSCVVVLGLIAIIATSGQVPIKEWVKVDDVSFDGYKFHDAFPIGDMVGVIGAGVWTSQDLRNWTHHALPATPTDGVIAQVAWFGSNFVGTGGHVWHSTDGLNWQTVGGFSTNQYATSARDVVKLANNTFLVVGTHGFAASSWTSSDGISWTETTSSSALGLRSTSGTSAVIKGMRTVARGPSVVVAGGYKKGDSATTNLPRFWYSTDNGSNWSVASGPFSGPAQRGHEIEEVFWAKDDMFYAFAESRVWKSTDSGQNWIIVGQGNPVYQPSPSRVHDLVRLGGTNVFPVVGSIGTQARLWSYRPGADKWGLDDPLPVFTTNPETYLLGGAYHNKLGYVFAGYSKSGTSISGSIWVQLPVNP